MNGLPDLRLLPDAPVPDGRTVLPTRTPGGVEAATESRAAPTPFHTGYQPARALHKEIGRRTDVVAIFPDDRALIRLASMIAIEANDEWLVGRAYMARHTMDALRTLGNGSASPSTTTSKEVRELQAA